MGHFAEISLYVHSRTEFGSDQKLKSVTGEIHRRIDLTDLSEIRALESALDSLITEREFVGKISTWPWEPNTIRGFGSAFLLPVLLWLVTRLLDRFL